MKENPKRKFYLIVFILGTSIFLFLLSSLYLWFAIPEGKIVEIDGKKERVGFETFMGTILESTLDREY